MRKVSWGVLGVSKMAVERTIPAMQLGRLSSIDAVASRDGARLETVESDRAAREVLLRLTSRRDVVRVFRE